MFPPIEGFDGIFGIQVRCIFFVHSNQNFAAKLQQLGKIGKKELSTVMFLYLFLWRHDAYLPVKKMELFFYLFNVLFVVRFKSTSDGRKSV